METIDAFVMLKRQTTLVVDKRQNMTEWLGQKKVRWV
jgi:hypothetical protein